MHERESMKTEDVMEEGSEIGEEDVPKRDPLPSISLEKLEVEKFGKVDVMQERLLPRDPIVQEVDEEAKRKRDEELDVAKHKNQLALHKYIRPFAAVAVAFLLLLFFGILPISEMRPTHTGAWDIIQDYARAFLSTGRTIGIALATLIVSDLMKRVYHYLKEHSSKE